MEDLEGVYKVNKLKLKETYLEENLNHLLEEVSLAIMQHHKIAYLVDHSPHLVDSLLNLPLKEDLESRTHSNNLIIAILVLAVQHQIHLKHNL